MLKYGRLNWRGTEVRASVYVGALMRHVAEWMEGENFGSEAGLHPLAHALACIAILLDAEAAGTLIDDRNYPGGYAELAEALTPHVARLKTLYADMKAPHHWTIRDAIAPGAGNLCHHRMPQMAERIRASAVAEITSLSVRTVLELAASGKIPGAAKLHYVWTFDPEKVRAWIRDQEAKACRVPVSKRTSTKGTGRYGGGSNSPAIATEQAFERLMQGKRKDGSKPGARA